MNCEPQSADRLKSQYRFLDVKTMEAFRLLYALFYSNEICVPSTVASGFYPNSANEPHDNREATRELGAKFKRLVVGGLLPFDSQVTKPYNQKGYLYAFVPHDLGVTLADEINRYDGIIAFVTPILVEQPTVENLVLTYDATREQEQASVPARRSMGEPYTQLALHTWWESYEFLREWMSDEVKNEFTPENYDVLVVISPSFALPSDYVVDATLRALDQVADVRP